MPWPHEFRTIDDLQEFVIMCSAGFPEPYTFSRRVYKHLRDRRDEFDLVHDNQCLGTGLLGFAPRRLAVRATRCTTRSPSTATSSSRHASGPMRR